MAAVNPRTQPPTRGPWPSPLPIKMSMLLKATIRESNFYLKWRHLVESVLPSLVFPFTPHEDRSLAHPALGQRHSLCRNRLPVDPMAQPQRSPPLQWGARPHRIAAGASYPHQPPRQSTQTCKEHTAFQGTTVSYHREMMAFWASLLLLTWSILGSHFQKRDISPMLSQCFSTHSRPWRPTLIFSIISESLESNPRSCLVFF